VSKNLPWFGGIYVAGVAILGLTSALVPSATDAWVIAWMATMPLAIVAYPLAAATAVLLPGPIGYVAVFLSFPATAYVQFQIARALCIAARTAYRDCQLRRARVA